MMIHFDSKQIYFLASDAGTPAIPQCVFGISVTRTLTFCFGAPKVSETVSVTLLINH